MLPITSTHVIAAFDRQEIDLAIMPFSAPPSRIARVPLVTQRFLGIARRGHPALADGPLTPETFASLPHVLISKRGETVGASDLALAERGLHRRIVMSVPHFLTVPLVVAATDLVTLLPERIARTFAARFDLALFEPPFLMRTSALDLLISAPRTNEPAIKWLQREILEVSESSVEPLPMAGPDSGADRPQAPRSFRCARRRRALARR